MGVTKFFYVGQSTPAFLEKAVLEETSFSTPQTLIESQSNDKYGIEPFGQPTTGASNIGDQVSIYGSLSLRKQSKWICDRSLVK